MKYIDCENCDQKAVSLNDTIRIDQKIYCTHCVDQSFPNEQSLKGRILEKNADPTICSSCATDFGSTELNPIGNYYFCDACEQALQKKVMPVWVKAFFAGILLLVVFSFAWNWKYYSAYKGLKDAADNSAKGDFKSAANIMDNASRQVPEVKDLAMLASYYKGIELLQEDHADQALVLLQQCEGHLPDDFQIHKLIMKAKSGAAFDNKKYAEFLSVNLDALKEDTTNPYSWAAVASAYACLYAEHGADSTQTASLYYLDQARKRDSSSADMKEYYNIIEYRLYSRKIITREEFIKQFPNGWTKNQ